MPLFSVYGDAYFLVVYGACCALSLVSLLGAAFAFVPAIARKRAPTTLATKVGGMLLGLCGVWACAALAVLSAFDYAPLWYVGLASTTVWLILTFPVVFTWSPLLGQFFMHPSANGGHRRRASGELRTPVKLDDGSVELTTIGTGMAGPLAGAALPPPSLAELRRRGSNKSSEAPVPSPVNASMTQQPHYHRVSVDGGTVRFTRALLTELKPQFRTVRTDVRLRWGHYIGCFVFGLAMSAVMIVMTYGACICSQPTEISTWAQRRLSAPVCNENAICHVYTLVGKDCTELVLVAHAVLGEGVDAAFAEASYVCSNASDCTDNNGTSAVVRTMRTWSDTQLSEDRRFVFAAVLAVKGGVTYNISVAVKTSVGSTLTSSNPLIVRALPCVTPRSGLRYIGGGDYRVGGVGEQVLLQGMSKSSDAMFYYIGGDLAYANNMRTCYRRWDAFFVETLRSIVRSKDGASLPLLVAVGNHEGGGYLQASTQSERRERFAFYNRYFPHFLSSTTPVVLPGAGSNSLSAAEDDTLTFHSHAIGDTLGIIVLDSDIVVPASDQLAFLNASALRLFAYRDDTSIHQNATLRQSRRLIVVYHNPAYPSTRDADNAVTQSVLRTFVPVMERINNASSLTFHPPVDAPQLRPIVCALEHHDHAYKRTQPVAGGAVALLEDGGIVYIGDGALGATPREAADAALWYIATTERSNYILDALLHANGSMHISAFRTDGSLMDQLIN